MTFKFFEDTLKNLSNISIIKKSNLKSTKLETCNCPITKFLFFPLSNYSINMSLPGLPPLPKSLSGFDLSQPIQQQPPTQQTTQIQQQTNQSTNNYHNLLQIQQQQLLQQQQNALSSTLNSFDSQRSLTSSSSSSISRKNSTLDTQLAILRREMVSTLFIIWEIYM